MKAIVLYGKHDVRLADFPESTVAEDSVKIQVAYCGLCGSDLNKYEGNKSTHPVHYPVPLGHEISGVIIEVGSKVTRFKPGDHVTVDPNWSCGKCHWCQNGKYMFCEDAKGVVKGMAEYVVSPESNVYRIPEGMDLRTAALTEPISCCLHGIDLLELQAGDTAAVVGFGAIGTMMVQLLKAVGAGKIIVVEADKSKRNAAIKMGASEFVCSLDRNSINRLAEKADILRVIECVGLSPAQELALHIAGKGATVVLFGVADEMDRLSFNSYDAFTKELSIKMSFVNPHTTARALAVLNSGVLAVNGLIGKVLSMAEMPNEIQTRVHSRKGKVLVEVNGNL
jgi:2-desacetyl-2-hydroxyethyl bacteriochlorophyllide A dehydrogenase